MKVNTDRRVEARDESPIEAPSAHFTPRLRSEMHKGPARGRQRHSLKANGEAGSSTCLLSHRPSESRMTSICTTLPLLPCIMTATLLNSAITREHMLLPMSLSPVPSEGGGGGQPGKQNDRPNGYSQPALPPPLRRHRPSHPRSISVLA